MKEIVSLPTLTKFGNLQSNLHNSRKRFEPLDDFDLIHESLKIIPNTRSDIGDERAQCFDDRDDNHIVKMAGVYCIQPMLFNFVGPKPLIQLSLE